MLKIRVRFFYFLLLLSANVLAGTTATKNNTPTLLIMGDSLSAGYGVAREKNWASLLMQKLQETRQPIKVINESISGETSSGALTRLPKLLERDHPQWVLIAIGANDGLRGQSLQQLENNLRSMVQLIRQSGATPLLAGMRLPPNYGKIYTDRFYAVFERIAAEEQLAFLPFLLENVGGHNERMQADGLHPNEQGHAEIVKQVWPFFKQHLSTP